MARDARRTVTLVIPVPVVVQSMNNTAFAVEPVGNHIEEFVVPSFVFSPEGIGDKVSVLDAASGG